MLTTNKAVYGTDGSLTNLGKLKGGASGNIQQSKTYTFEGSSDGVLIDYIKEVTDVTRINADIQ